MLPGNESKNKAQISNVKKNYKVMASVTVHLFLNFTMPKIARSMFKNMNLRYVYKGLTFNRYFSKVKFVTHTSK